jgi:NADH-quinone oxidoreductase subunit I
MATIIVQRPKLAWHERWFISTLLKGLKITVGHGIKTFLQIAGRSRR